jgi:hypothetical protein
MPFTSILRLVPTAWLWGAAGVLGLAMAGAIGVQTVRVYAAQAEIAKVQSAWDKQTAEREEAARTAERNARVEERRLAADNLENVNEAERLAARLRDIAAAAAVGDRVRDFTRTAAARCDRTHEAATAAGAGAPAASAGDLLSDLSRGLYEAGRELAVEAETRRIAGLTCERDAESVRR